MTIQILATIFAFTTGTTASAATTDCHAWDRSWQLCEKDADCTILPDRCGLPRMAVNKVHSAEAAKSIQCTVPADLCTPLTTEQKIPPPYTCDSYTIKGMSAKDTKSPPPTCMRISDIVGMAINNDDLQKMEAMIEVTKDVDMSLSHIHETPLSLAAMNGKTAQVKWLLERGAKINRQTVNGYTALMFAALARAGAAETVTFLLKSGADKTLRNSRGGTAMDEAVMAKNAAVIQLLK